MHIMARAAAITSSIFKSSFLSARSRPPPDYEPLKWRPSPLPASVLSTGRGRSQVPRVATLMVVSILVTAMQTACGSDENDHRGRVFVAPTPTPSPTLTANEKANQQDRVAWAKMPALTPTPTSTPEPTSTPTAVPSRASLMRHSEKVTALLRSMRLYIYSIKELESDVLNAGRHTMETASRIPCTEEMKEIYVWCFSPEIAKEQREKAQTKRDAYRADNARYAAEWLEMSMRCASGPLRTKESSGRSSSA